MHCAIQLDILLVNLLSPASAKKAFVSCELVFEKQRDLS
jgi:hypothetical protein